MAVERDKLRERPPVELTRFDAGEWGGGPVAVERWTKACFEWLAGDRERRLPVGDSVDLIRESARLKIELLAEDD